MLLGVLIGDTVTVHGAGATGNFVVDNVGTNIAVTVCGLTLTGPEAGDYALLPPTTKASITPASSDGHGDHRRDQDL